MELKLNIALTEETKSLFQGLIDAVNGLKGASVTNSISAEKTGAEDDTGPFFWADNSNGKFGKVDTKAEYDKLKKKQPGVFRIDESMHERKVEELRLANEKAREEAAAQKKGGAGKGKAEPAEKPEAAELPVASVEDLVAVFASYLPKELSDDEKKPRRAFVKAILARFGNVEKASAIAEGDRALAINFVQRKMAGEDIDPAKAEYAEVSAAEEASDDDMI